MSSVSSFSLVTGGGVVDLKALLGKLCKAVLGSEGSLGQVIVQLTYLRGDDTRDIFSSSNCEISSERCSPSPCTQSCGFGYGACLGFRALGFRI